MDVNTETMSVDALQDLGGVRLLLQVDSSSRSATDWAKDHGQDVDRLLQENGAVLVRGLKVHTSKQFGEFLELVFGSPLLDYSYRSTPRTELRGGVYTATEYPAEAVIPQHNEKAYSRSWPNRIGFLCMVPSAQGGETPISDSRLLSKLLPRDVQEKFDRKGIRYVRNYSSLDLPWQEVFQTQLKSEVEQYCRKNGLDFEWLGGDTLRTTQVNPAFARHPVTGERIWFNQAHLFHVSSLPDEVRDTLIESLGQEHLPRNAYYGDGSPIEPEVLNAIRGIYEDTKIKFKWERNDILLLDNMVFTHGREAYVGERKVLTGMACENAVALDA
jgi:hypothetical protein